VAVTEATQNAAHQNPDFELEKTILPYKIFRIKRNDRHYVVPLKFKPVFVRTKTWKRLYFDWFRLTENNVFLASPCKNKIPDEYSLRPSSTLNLNHLPAEPLSGEVNVRETVKPQEIFIETDKIGHPLLIKVSFHPNWHVQGADAVYMASPGFMVVFPKSHKVRLFYKQGFTNHVGWISSLLGIFLLCLPLSLLYRNKGLSLFLGFKCRWLIFGLVILGIIGLGLHFHYDAHTLYYKGLKHFHKEEYDKAQRFFRKGINTFPFSPAVDGSYLFYGLSYYKKELWVDAISVWKKFLKKYPEGRFADEMLYHIGLSYQFLKKEQEARAVFDELKKKFPNSRFSNLVR
jgi:hypothetical protein